MNLLPKSHADFAKEEYWNEFFRKRGSHAFEWYGEYPQLCGILFKYLRPKDHVLIVGCGNSSLSADLYDSGYRNSVSIDISDVVVKQMTKKYCKERPELQFVKMDMLQTSFKEAEFNAVLDKGTLDALMTDDSKEKQQDVDKMFREISRLLKFGGRYICISLLQLHILKKILQWFTEEGWMVRIQRCIDAEESNENRESSLVFPVFVVVCTKLQKIPGMKNVLELSLTNEGSFERMNTIEDIVNSVQSVQHYAMIRHKLNTRNYSEENVKVELFAPPCPHPRYTLYVVDSLHSHPNKKFAIFITPQGREIEWLFGAAEGQRQLAKNDPQFQRLVIVHLNRYHQYASLDEVKAELSGKVMELAPKGLGPNAEVPFLSIRNDVGKREIRHQGTSEFSGDFVVEDVTCDNVTYRRLVFLSNQTLIQSEARLKSVSARKKKKQLIVDHSYLACNHHASMIAGLAFIAPKVIDTEANALLIGLGGGSLASYMTQYLKKLNLLAVDIDEAMVNVATEWFGLKIGDSLKTTVANGIDVIQKLAQEGKHYDAVFLDADSKDTSVGMSCPPASFVDVGILRQLAGITQPSGVVILNLVCRDESMKKFAYDQLSKVFECIFRISVPEEVNEVVYCLTSSNADKQLMLNNVKKHLEKLVKQLKTQSRSEDDLIDITDLMANLHVVSNSCIKLRSVER